MSNLSKKYPVVDLLEKFANEYLTDENRRKFLQEFQDKLKEYDDSQKFPVTGRMISHRSDQELVFNIDLKSNQYGDTFELKNTPFDNAQPTVMPGMTVGNESKRDLIFSVNLHASNDNGECVQLRGLKNVWDLEFIDNIWDRSGKMIWQRNRKPI